MKHTKESKEKISASLRGKTGEASRRWKGDNASYVAKHMWITKHFKKPNKCSECGTGDYTRLEWANISGEHIRDISDYIALCPSCHRKRDLYSTHCKNGHPREGNTMYNTRGHKVCIICNKISQKKYREKRNGKGN